MVMFYPKYFIHFVLFIQFIRARPEQPDWLPTILPGPNDYAITGGPPQMWEMARALMPYVIESSREELCLCHVPQVIFHHSDDPRRHNCTATLSVCKLQGGRNCTLDDPCWRYGVPITPDRCLQCYVKLWIKDRDTTKPNFIRMKCEPITHDIL